MLRDGHVELPTRNALGTLGDTGAVVHAVARRGAVALLLVAHIKWTAMEQLPREAADLHHENGVGTTVVGWWLQEERALHWTALHLWCNTKQGMLGCGMRGHAC